MKLQDLYKDRTTQESESTGPEFENLRVFIYASVLVVELQACTNEGCVVLVTLVSLHVRRCRKSEIRAVVPVH